MDDNEIERILVVVAHPDDVDFSAALERLVIAAAKFLSDLPWRRSG